VNDDHVPAAVAVTVPQLVSTLVEYGRHNGVTSVAEAEGYLQALADTFPETDCRDVTSKELHTFHRQYGSGPGTATVAALVDKKSSRWEAAYTLRAEGVVSCLQWENPRPVRALVRLFDRPDFRPLRVLELGCGNGVNAVFMAERGCEVTAVDLSTTALRMARDKAKLAGVSVDLVESDIFALDSRLDGYDFVFDRGMFHHVPAFEFEDYKNLVADRLRSRGHFQLICHHVSTRPTMLIDCVSGFVGKVLGFLTGALVETGAGFTLDELHDVYDDRFEFLDTDLIWDDNNRPLCFLSALMRRVS
jgi:SAM-dependent methyltransferase